MRLFNSIKMIVFITPEELKEDISIEEKIVGCLKKLAVVDLEKEKIPVKMTKVEGFNNREIKIYEIILEKESHTNAFMKSFLERLNPDQKGLLLRQKESRLDEGLGFFIRLGKKELLRDDIYLTDSGDCFHIRMAVAAFPKKREVALGIIEKPFA